MNPNSLEVNMKIAITLFLFTIIFLTSNVSSSPMIEADTAEVNRGNIIKKELKDLHHIYTLKNTGDEVLKIKRVKPGCGCTMVDYDSVIAPGKTGTVEIKIKKNKLGDGSFTKALRVMSNAVNEPNLRLSISGKILSPIDVSKRFLRIESEESNAKAELIISSQKKDLKISEVKFIEKAGGSPDQPALPDLIAKTSLSPTGEVDNLGYKSYKLSLNIDVAPTNILSGSFVITTNHPEQKTINLRGMILPPAKKGK